MSPVSVLCADHSRAVGEALIGTTARADLWFLLEYNEAWNAQALPESKLSSAIKAHFDALGKTLPQSRFQFIRHHKSKANGRRFFVVDSQRAAIGTFFLEDYEDLLALDLVGLASGTIPLPQSPDTPSELYLVCTHGRRDPACSRYGLPVYQAMRAYAGDCVWQTTHLGGHRFAGTVAFLPHGLVYGFVEPESVGRRIDAYRQGKIGLEGYRGRCVLDTPAQAAEAFLIEQSGEAGLGAWRWLHSETCSPTQWRVRFENSAGVQQDVMVYRELSSYSVLKSTGDEKAVPVPLYKAEWHDSTA